MNFIKKNGSGILVCLAIAIPAWLLGKTFPVVGGAVIAIIAGMIIAMFWRKKGKAEAGIKWTSKIILQTAVVLLGFGMNLGAIPSHYHLHDYYIASYCMDFTKSP